MRTAQMPEVIFGCRMYVSVEASKLTFPEGAFLFSLELPKGAGA
jgi:hypothetical protein